MRTRLFHSIVGVAIALAPSGCENAELSPRAVDASVDEVGSDTAVVDSGVVESAVIDSEVVDSAETTEPADTADAADAAADTADTADTHSDAPTDADASDGWPPTK